MILLPLLAVAEPELSYRVSLPFVCNFLDNIFRYTNQIALLDSPFNRYFNYASIYIINFLMSDCTVYLKTL